MWAGGVMSGAICVLMNLPKHQKVHKISRFADDLIAASSRSLFFCESLREENEWMMSWKKCAPIELKEIPMESIEQPTTGISTFTFTKAFLNCARNASHDLLRV